MQIIWHGQGCFTVKSQDLDLLIDPISQQTGLKIPHSWQADVLFLSHQDSPYIDAGKIKAKGLDRLFIIDHPGEYEKGGLFIYGLPAKPEQHHEPGQLMLGLMNIENITLGYLGDIGTPLTNGQVETLEGVDILFIPVGGHQTLSPTQAAQTIAQLEPRLVIPCCYKIPGLKISLDPIDKFIKEMGIKDHQPQSSLKITRKDLTLEETRFVILEPK